MDTYIKLTGTGPILLVDDDDAEAHLLQRCYELSALRNELIWLNSGLALLEHLRAVAKLEAEMPELIMLDLHMPGIDGLQTLRLIGQYSDAKRPAIIVFTNSQNPFHREKAKNLGADAFAVKAVDPAETVEYFNSMAA